MFAVFAITWLTGSLLDEFLPARGGSDSGWRFAFAVIGGIVAGLFLLYRGIIRRNYSVFTALPYGPNIIIAMLVVLIWQKDLGVLLRQAIYGGGG